ncbi:hypothetical protein KIL84_013592, partial [Mauremys mutica]
EPPTLPTASPGRDGRNHTPCSDDHDGKAAATQTPSSGARQVCVKEGGRRLLPSRVRIDSPSRFRFFQGRLLKPGVPRPRLRTTLSPQARWWRGDQFGRGSEEGWSRCGGGRSLTPEGSLEGPGLPGPCRGDEEPGQRDRGRPLPVRRGSVWRPSALYVRPCPAPAASSARCLGPSWSRRSRRGGGGGAAGWGESRQVQG